MIAYIQHKKAEVIKVGQTIASSSGIEWVVNDVLERQDREDGSTTRVYVHLNVYDYIAATSERD